MILLLAIKVYGAATLAVLGLFFELRPSIGICKYKQT